VLNFLLVAKKQTQIVLLRVTIGKLICIIAAMQARAERTAEQRETNEQGFVSDTTPVSPRHTAQYHGGSGSGACGEIHAANQAGVGGGEPDYLPS
jgi:hypothetical protein